MTTLIFKNSKLQDILEITTKAVVFNACLTEAIEAYENDAQKKYSYGADLSKYREHNTPTFWLVKDSGIYLMTSAKLKKNPTDKNHVCYAEGFEPNAPNSYDKCKAAVGGDDFVVSFPFTDQLKKELQDGADIHIRVYTDKFIVEAIHP